jgi:hypothetical protein
MTTNFKIIDNYALEINGRLIDIHNNFDFVTYDYCTKENQVKLFCRKGSGNWIDKEEIKEIVLVHSDVNNFIIENQNEHSEDSITEITFYQIDEFRKPEELTLREKPNENDEIFYIFESGKVMRISCSEIKLELNRS